MSIPSINTEEKKPDLEADQLTERRGEERKRGEGERCDELEQAFLLKGSVFLLHLRTVVLFLLLVDSTTFSFALF